MSTKKVKGQKLDLATFVGADTANLPSGPDLSRQYEPRGSSGFGGTGSTGSGSSRWGGGGGGSSNDRNSDRNGDRGGYDDSRDNRYNGQRGLEEMTPSQSDNNWRKSSGSTSGFSNREPSGNSRGPSRPLPYNQSRSESVEARPDHLKLNLAPRSDGSSSNPDPSKPSSEEPTTDTGVVEDKWSKAFKNMSTSDTTSSQPFRARGGDIDRGGDSGDRRGGGGGRDRDGGGYGRSGGGGPRSRGDRDNRNNDTEEIDDPRFAGKFSNNNNNSGGGGGGGYRDRGDRDRGDRDRGDRYRGGGSHQEPRIFGPLPTAPRSAMVDAPRPPVIPVAKGPTEEELNAAEELKLLKLAKAQAKEEAERKRREEKEQQALEEANRRQKEKEDQLVAMEAAGSMLDSGLKGSALVDLINESSKSPTGAALLREILDRQPVGEGQDLLASKWWIKTEYGPALTKLLGDSLENQKKVLFEIQNYCFVKKFPKVEIKGQQRKLIEVLFNLMLSNQYVSAEGILAWCDDENEDPGRTDAIVQTTHFIQSLRDALADGDDEEDEDEDDEVDAPRQIVK